MYQFEIDLKAGPEAERFNTAVYQFLELHGGGPEGLSRVRLETAPSGRVEHKTLTLWSADSLDAFQRYWARKRVLNGLAT